MNAKIEFMPEVLHAFSIFLRKISSEGAEGRHMTPVHCSC